MKSGQANFETEGLVVAEVSNPAITTFVSNSTSVCVGSGKQSSGLGK
jgi:hypothetical protein